MQSPVYICIRKPMGHQGITEEKMFYFSSQYISFRGLLVKNILLLDREGHILSLFPLEVYISLSPFAKYLNYLCFREKITTEY